MWLVCVRYVVGIWLVCGQYVVSMWSVCVRHMVGIWSVCGHYSGMWSVCVWYMVSMWSVGGQHVVNIWSACGQYLVSMWLVYMISMWSVCGLYVTGIWSVCDQYVVGTVCGRYVVSMYVLTCHAPASFFLDSNQHQCWEGDHVEELNHQCHSTWLLAGVKGNWICDFECQKIQHHNVDAGFIHTVLSVVNDHTGKVALLASSCLEWHGNLLICGKTDKIQGSSTTGYGFRHQGELVHFIVPSLNPKTYTSYDKNNVSNGHPSLCGHCLLLGSAVTLAFGMCTPYTSGLEKVLTKIRKCIPTIRNRETNAAFQKHLCH